jgi:hypothetical protein
MDVSGKLHASVALPPGKESTPCTHWTGGWVGARAGIILKLSERSRIQLAQDMGLVAGSCKHGNESSGPKGVKFLD